MRLLRILRMGRIFKWGDPSVCGVWSVVAVRCRLAPEGVGLDVVNMFQKHMDDLGGGLVLSDLLMFNL